MEEMRRQFLRHVAQTSPVPMGVDVSHASGCTIFDTDGKEYLDFNAGICVSVLGHNHQRVVQAVKDQMDKYMHTMVYGEHIQAPQVQFATLLTDQLPDSLESVYFTNSGSEAVEGAMKLAKRYTGRYEFVACRNSYHGSTHGAESLRSDRETTSAFRPLVPGIRHMDYNSLEDLAVISEKTAAVIVEVVQAGSGVRKGTDEWLRALRQRCDEMGALLIFDEIQTGSGRTGKLFAFQHSGVVPDILLVAKAFGGGLPLGGFISSYEMMQTLTHDPVLGHLTTYGGHAVCCASGLAALKELLETDLIDKVGEKERLIRSLLVHSLIQEVRSAGLMIAVELPNEEIHQKVIQYSWQHGLMVDWFLFNHRAIRISPPLVIEEQDIRKACGILLEALDFASK